MGGEPNSYGPVKRPNGYPPGVGWGVRASEFGLSLVGLGIYLAVGAVWSRSTWSRGEWHFELGWLLVGAAVAYYVCATVSGSPPSRKDWIVAVSFWVTALIFEAAADYSLHRFSYHPQTALLVLFGACHWLFLLAILAGGAVLPF